MPKKEAPLEYLNNYLPAGRVRKTAGIPAPLQSTPYHHPHAEKAYWAITVMQQDQTITASA